MYVVSLFFSHPSYAPRTAPDAHPSTSRAGVDAARAFGTGCFKDHRTHDLRGLSESELQARHVYAPSLKPNPLTFIFILLFLLFDAGRRTLEKVLQRPQVVRQGRPREPPADRPCEPAPSAL